jgi:hypothetical protein
VLLLVQIPPRKTAASYRYAPLIVSLIDAGSGLGRICVVVM